MRTLLATLLLLAFLAATLPMPASAQDVSAPLGEDPAGDVTGRAIGSDQRQAVSGFEDVDLTGLWLWEDPDLFHVKLRLAHMDGQPGPDQPATYVRFTHDGVEFEVYQGRSSDNEAWFASLRSGEPGALYPRYVAPLRSAYDVEAGLVWTEVPRELIVGASGATPAQGDVLENVWAWTRAVGASVATINLPEAGLVGPVLEVGDRLPDADGLAVPVQLRGATGAGGLALGSPTPYRASNGAAATFVFDVEARNDGEAARDLTLAAQHLPDGWNLTLPGDRLRLEPGATVSFQAVLTTAFNHQHGTSRAFHLRMADPADDGAWANLELGIHYLAVPQPAGHHDTLWLHTHPWSASANTVNAPLGGTDGVLTFNTLQEDPEDSGKPLLAYSSTAGNGDFYGWAGCLDPALALGLEFDLSRTGVLTLPISTGKPMPAATLSGRILYVGPSDMQYCFPSEYYDLDVVELAAIEETEAAFVDANGQHTFEATITPLQQRQAYEPGGHLVLELSVYGGGMATGGLAGLALQPGGSMTLPLLEYNDTVPMLHATGDAPAAAGFVAPEAQAEDAPAPGLGLAALALVALALVRRRA